MARESYDIRGRTVFITGAARGIGAGTAERMHAKGANVALVGLEPERLEELAGKLGERAAWFEADVTDMDALRRAVDGTVERFGGIDVAMANAGIAYVEAMESAPIEHVERTLEVNLQGVVRTDLAVLPHVIERRGYILNIASLAAAGHAPLMAPYAASKAGVEAFSDSLRVELAARGASVGCAYFGFIDTDIVRGSRRHPATEIMQRSLPGFLRKPAPLSAALDAIERGIERRSARLWAPGFVGTGLRLRGFLQPLTERRAAANPGLPEALRLADPASGAGAHQDSPLGAAAAEVGERAPAG